MIYEYNKETVEDLILKLTEEDKVQICAEDFLNLVGKVGKPKGRKPIAFDEAKFKEVFELWQGGIITARAAMTELGLKPNTFYRRVKEYTEMTDIKDLKKAIKEETKELKAQAKEDAKELKAALKAGEQELKANYNANKEDMKDLAAQVKSEAKEFKAQLKKDAKDLEATIDSKKMETEIFKEKLEAQLERDKEIRDLEQEVAAEAAAIKDAGLFCHK